MLRLVWWSLVGGGVVVVLVGMLGCGSSGSGGGSGDGVAVVVAGHPISRATVAHWLPIEAVLSYETAPKGPPVPGVIPDPPAYTACIGLEEAHAKAMGGNPPPSKAKLKHACEERDATIRDHMLNLLILYRWLQGEAAEDGIKITDGEVKHQLEVGNASQFRSEQEFQSFLHNTGQTMSDELQRVKLNLLATKILQDVIQRAGHTPQQNGRAYAEFLLKWVHRTDCQPGYITPDCRQYKGPRQPGS